MKKITLMLFTSLLLSNLSCATAPPDFALCVEMSLTRGECLKVISGEKVTVDDTHKMNEKTWWEARPTNLILPMESWAQIKEFIIKLCKKNKGMCDKEISTWERSLQGVDQAIEEKATVRNYY